jgi:hypothetical protein
MTWAEKRRPARASSARVAARACTKHAPPSRRSTRSLPLKLFAGMEPGKRSPRSPSPGRIPPRSVDVQAPASQPPSRPLHYRRAWLANGPGTKVLRQYDDANVMCGLVWLRTVCQQQVVRRCTNRADCNYGRRKLSETSRVRASGTDAKHQLRRLTAFLAAVPGGIAGSVLQGERIRPRAGHERADVELEPRPDGCRL